MPKRSQVVIEPETEGLGTGTIGTEVTIGVCDESVPPPKAFKVDLVMGPVAPYPVVYAAPEHTESLAHWNLSRAD